MNWTKQCGLSYHCLDVAIQCIVLACPNGKSLTEPHLVFQLSSNSKICRLFVYEF